MTARITGAELYQRALVDKTPKNTARRKTSQEIAAEIDAFLANGGSITECETGQTGIEYVNRQYKKNDR